MNARDILIGRYPDELIDLLISYFKEIERSYRLESWKPSELDSGHFVEVARRIIEHELFGTYTPVSKSLGSFNPSVLGKYESSSGDESLRIIMPRILYSMYCVRNKRGVGHVGSISPNKMDATFILSSAKWVLAEFIRIAGQTVPEIAHSIIDDLTDKHVDLVWSDEETFMILDAKMKAADKVLVALYKEDNINIGLLQQRIHYKNKSDFKKIIKQLEASKLLHWTEQDSCKLSPLGVREVENRIM